jgi:CRISPR-associated endoribonuclease Cas6
MALAYLTSWWTALEEETLLQVGSYQGSLESVHLDDTPWAGVSTWADITAQRLCSHLRLTFITPMVPIPSEEASFAFPEPISIFSRLYERWNSLGGPQLSMTVETLVSATRCVVSDYQLTVVSSSSTSLPLRGYDGWVAFECCARHREAIRILNMLARLAFYTGLGYYTERGMGATSVVQEG